jgi:hypothetical protein
VARYVRAFTLDAATISALDSLLQEGPRGKNVETLFRLFPNLAKIAPSAVEVPILDASDLQPSDYAELYALLPPSRPLADWSVKLEKYTTPLRQPTWASLLATVQDYAGLHSTVFSRARTLQKLNRRAVRHAHTLHARAEARKPTSAAATVNVSRCADALLILGLTVLKERAAAAASSEGSPPRAAASASPPRAAASASPPRAVDGAIQKSAGKGAGGRK